MDTGKNSGFRIPEGYFEEFPDRLKERIKASGGTVLPEDSGFRVPEGYFENFESRLRDRMEQPKGRVKRLWQPYLGWAAAVAAGIALTLVLWPARPTVTPNFEDLAATEIEAYLEAGFGDISAYELAETLPLQNIGMTDVMETNPQEELILEYLNEDEEALDELYWEEDE